MSTVDVVLSLDVAVDSDPIAVPVEELPSRLALAVAGVLGADGASLSLLGLELRVPLGASDPGSAVAEQLQFTLGEGPCLEVLHTHRPAAHNMERLSRAWPVFTDRLTAATAFRSVASTPLPFTADGGGGAMDLYYCQPNGSAGSDPAAAAAAAEWVVRRLLGSQPVLSLAGADDASKVPWLESPATRRRIEVWVAIGSVSTHLDITVVDALAVLRGWAYSHDTDIDTIAADIAAGRLHAEQVRP